MFDELEKNPSYDVTIVDDDLRFVKTTIFYLCFFYCFPDQENISLNLADIVEFVTLIIAESDSAIYLTTLSQPNPSE